MHGSSDSISAGIRQHHQQWNSFADQLYRLHIKGLRDKDYYTFEKTGGYGGLTNNQEYYREVTYLDRISRRKLSVIKWENVYPFRIHIIDLFAYDKQGRIKREYSATYLPSRHTSPSETLIIMHTFKGHLHSYREFDASNIKTYEQCEDIRSGRVIFALHYEDIPGSISELEQEKQAAYIDCFAHTENTAKPYTDPVNDPLL